MPKLSEVLSGIVKDVGQAQLSNELLLVEHLKLFQDHELLKLMPLSRVRIKDAQLRLRFAISEIEPHAVSDNARNSVSEFWVQHLKNNLLETVLRGLVSNPAAFEKVKPEVQRAISSARIPDFKGDDLISGRPTQVLKLTEDLTVSIIGKLSREMRSSFPKTTVIRKSARGSIQQALQGLRPKFEKIARAQSAQDFDLNVFVTKSELQGLPENEFQELSINLVLDDIDINLE